MNLRASIFFILIISSLSVFAQDVMMATSEDLKEFDRMVAKKIPPLQSQGQPPLQNPGQVPPGKGKKNYRADFNHVGGERPSQGRPRNMAKPPTIAGSSPKRRSPWISTKSVIR